MKRILPCFLMLCSAYSSIASISDSPKTADGYLTAGEYASISLEGSEKLIVLGGDSAVIDVWGSSRLEIYSTSLPLSYEGKRGVYDIHLYDSSTLLFSGGATESLMVGKNASALLTGGNINLLTIYNRPQDSCFVTIDCKKGYEWLYTASKVTGIRGLWHNGTPFQIAFGNAPSPYPPTANFVNVIPEPASLTLLGLGVIFLRQREGRIQ